MTSPIIEAGQALGYLPRLPLPAGAPTTYHLNKLQMAEVHDWLQSLPEKTGYELDRIEWGLTD